MAPGQDDPDLSAHTGGCACGQVRFRTHGPPRRAGLCHCLTCRKAHAAAFNPFVVFDRVNVEITGVLGSWSSSPGYARRFCAACGSRVCGEIDGEAELSIGSFDKPGLFSPQYESFAARREPWLKALDVPQFEGERTQGPAEAPPRTG